MTSKIINTGTDANGGTTYVEGTETLFESIVGAITAPLDLFKAETTKFLSSKAVALRVVTGAIVGMELGDRFALSPSRAFSGLR